MQSLNIIGLVLTLAGACLLFVYGFPTKKIGNVVVMGDSAMKVAPEPDKEAMPDSVWQPIASRFQRRAKILNSTGFALVALGTLLQIVAVCAQ